VLGAVLGASMGASAVHCFLRAPLPLSPTRPSEFPSICSPTHSSARSSISAHLDVALDVVLAAALAAALAVAWLFLHASSRSSRSCFDPANLRRKRIVKSVLTKLTRAAAMSQTVLESLGKVDTFVEPLLDAWRGFMEHQSAEEILRNVACDVAEDVAVDILGPHFGLL
jgi:hypothetical protein